MKDELLMVMIENLERIKSFEKENVLDDISTFSDYSILINASAIVLVLLNVD